VGKAAGAGDDGEQKGHQRVGGRDGVGAAQLERHRGGQWLREGEALEEPQEVEGELLVCNPTQSKPFPQNDAFLTSEFGMKTISSQYPPTDHLSS
jgi:hypothetical protein